MYPYDSRCVDLRDKGSIRVVHIMLMTLHCVAPEERRLNRGVEKGYVRQMAEDQ